MTALSYVVRPAKKHRSTKGTPGSSWDRCRGELDGQRPLHWPPGCNPSPGRSSLPKPAGMTSQRSTTTVATTESASACNSAAACARSLVFCNFQHLVGSRDGNHIRVSNSRGIKVAATDVRPVPALVRKHTFQNCTAPASKAYECFTNVAGKREQLGGFRHRNIE